MPTASSDALGSVTEGNVESSASVTQGDVVSVTQNNVEFLDSFCDAFIGAEEL
jgi:hypothetical protein